MRHFNLTIREKGGAVLHPSYVGDVDEAFLVRHFGLDEPDVESYEIREVKTCCICGMEFEGNGNNAAPVKDGICCDACNSTVVVPERLRLSTIKQ